MRLTQFKLHPIFGDRLLVMEQDDFAVAEGFTFYTESSTSKPRVGDVLD